MNNCKVFICKYMSTCLYGVDCEEGLYPRDTCFNSKCELCRLYNHCSLKNALQKGERKNV